MQNVESMNWRAQTCRACPIEERFPSRIKVGKFLLLLNLLCSHAPVEKLLSADVNAHVDTLSDADKSSGSAKALESTQVAVCSVIH
eukprot:768576-Hanusia_phi.AAC.2